MKVRNICFKWLIAGCLVPLLIFSKWAPAAVAQERIFLATDREAYIAGEHLLFALTLFSSSAPKSKIAYLILRNQENKNVATANIWLTNDFFSGRLYLHDTLSTGTYQLLAFTNIMRADEEAFYSGEIFVASRFDQNLNFISPSKNFAKAAKAYEPLPDTAFNFSADAGTVRGEQAQNFLPEINQEHFTVSISDKAPGRREKEEVYFKYSGEDSLIFLCISVTPKLAQGLYLPQNIRSGFSGNPEGKSVNRSREKNGFLLENEGFVLSGRIANTNTTGNLSDKLVFLYTQDSFPYLDYAPSDSSGNFLFLLPNYYTGKTILLNVEGVKGGSAAHSVFADNKFKTERPYLPSAAVFPSGFKEYIKRSQKAATVEREYAPPQAEENKINMKEQRPLPLYSKTDFEVFPAEYQPLENFTEISRNLIPFLKIRKKGSAYRSNILNPETAFFYNQEASIFMDGIKLESIAQIIELGSESIRKIEVVNTKRFFGRLEFYGIINVVTNGIPLSGLKWKSNPLLMSLADFKPSAEHINKTYPEGSEATEKTPDFRQLLYWKAFSGNVPEIGTTEFYTSDLQGDYIIHITGLNSKGRVVNASYSFSVQ